MSKYADKNGDRTSADGGYSEWLDEKERAYHRLRKAEVKGEEAYERLRDKQAQEKKV